MKDTIPVYVIAGFLGSGKTTLLTRALDAYNAKGLRPVVIMNELGDVNLDGIAVGETNGTVPMAELLGGCICCSIRADLSLQLHELVTAYRPDAVFIEATGAAQPLEIMDSVTEASLYLPITLERVVTVMDGAVVRDAAEDKLVGKTVRLLRDQVRCATDVLLNKVDRLTPEEADRAEALLREWNAHAPILRTVRSEVGLERVFGTGGSHEWAKPARQEQQQGHRHGEEHAHVSAYTHFLKGPVNSLAFEAFMKQLPEGVYRAKGIVTFTDTASRYLFQYAYRELDFTRITPQGEVNDVAVFLGEQFSKQDLAEPLNALEREAVREQLQEAYNGHAEARDTGTLQDWKAVERDRFLQELRRSGAQSLLELGAGPGRDSLFFREQGFRVTAVDLSPEMVRLCREKGLEAHAMDMSKLDFPDEAFDAVYALNSLLHIPKAELETVLRGIRRVLKPGGRFYMGVYGGVDRDGIWDKDFYEPKRYFAMYEDEAMREAVGRVFDVVYFGVVKVSESEGEPHFQSMILS